MKSVVLPRSLFRFRSANSQYFLEELERSIFQKQIFLSRASEQNDPYEMSPKIVRSDLREVAEWVRKHEPKGPIDRKKYSSFAGRKVSRNEFRSARSAAFKRKSTIAMARINRSFAEKLISDLPRETLMASFSETMHSAPMWAHYSRDHTGVCVEYEVDWHCKESEPFFPLVVSYSTNRPAVNTIDLLGYVKGLAPEFEDEVFTSLVLSKSQDWAYEKEWRVTCQDKGGPRYFKVPCLSVKRVVLGAKCSPIVARLLKERFIHEPVVFHQAVPSTDKYEIEVREI